MKIKIILLIAFFITSVSAYSQNNNSFSVQTKIKNGLIEGNYDTKTNIQKYFGIPFAKPPVGSLRWKAPEPLENWSGVKQTKSFGPRPMQTNVFGDMNSRSDGVSEDCLYLNVWTPAEQNTKGLPVLLYYYGGGNVAGDASEPRYDGEAMAKEGIVVVTANYRLNIFGFLAHPNLSQEASYKTSGNYGMLDQNAALKWVKENIEAFGGDPSKITIAGESAGSIGVSLHMASPMSRNLIAGAIGESGAAIFPTMPPVSLAEAEKIGEEFVKKAGYNTIEEMRNLPARAIYEIYNKSRRFGFPTVIDGYFLEADLPTVFTQKKQAQIPLLVGWNSAEIPGQALMQGKEMNSKNYEEVVKNLYPNNFQEVLKLYPSGDNPDWSATMLAADRFIVYSTWKWFDLHRKNSEQPVYRYLFSKIRPSLKDKTLAPGLAGGTRRADASMPKDNGARHAIEIEYAMGNLPLVHEYEWTEEDYKTSKTFFNYFANFIKNGNPNGENLPNWSKSLANDTNPDFININAVTAPEKASNDARYEFLDKEFNKK